MLCYRDRSYCILSVTCEVEGCPRMVTEDVVDGASDAGLPISISDFDVGCYIGEDDVE